MYELINYKSSNQRKHFKIKKLVKLLIATETKKLNWCNRLTVYFIN